MDPARLGNTTRLFMVFEMQRVLGTWPRLVLSISPHGAGNIGRKDQCEQTMAPRLHRGQTRRAAPASFVGFHDSLTRVLVFCSGL